MYKECSKVIGVGVLLVLQLLLLFLFWLLHLRSSTKKGLRWLCCCYCTKPDSTCLPLLCTRYVHTYVHIMYTHTHTQAMLTRIYRIVTYQIKEKLRIRNSQIKKCNIYYSLIRFTTRIRRVAIRSCRCKFNDWAAAVPLRLLCSRSQEKRHSGIRCLKFERKWSKIIYFIFSKITIIF